MNIVVAACKNRGIGMNNKLPWNIKNEMQYFKQLTIGNGNNAVVMGKNTWLSLKKPLPKRSNFILSKTLQKNDVNGNATILKNINDIDILYDTNKFDNIWIIGGEVLYKSMVYNSKLNGIFYTNIENYYDCDTFFPVIPNNFSLTYTSKNKVDETNTLEYNYNIYQNIHNYNDEKKNIALIRKTQNIIYKS